MIHPESIPTSPSATADETRAQSAPVGEMIKLHGKQSQKEWRLQMTDEFSNPMLELDLKMKRKICRP